jgi:hypothetical protein
MFKNRSMVLFANLALFGALVLPATAHAEKATIAHAQAMGPVRAEKVRAAAAPKAVVPNHKADFNGDGYDDLAISVFAYDVNGAVDAGAVSVIYGGPGGLDALAGPGNQLWTQDSPGIPDQAELNDLWGRALATADFNDDGYSDLAIGDGHEDDELVGMDTGAVTVIYGGPNGLDAFAGPGAQYWTQDSPGILDKEEGGDLFGRSVYGADFNGDGFDDLVIGAAYEDVNNVFDSGAVNVIYGSAAGLTATGNQFLSQDTPGILDQSEKSERFGWSVTGADFNQDGFADLAVGVPGEELNGLVLAGAVNVVYGSAVGLTATGNQFWNQDSPGMLDQVEASDLFGRNVVPGDFNGDGFADLMMAVPSEGVGPQEIPDAGACQVLYGTPIGLTSSGNQLWTQDSPGIKDQAEAHDQFCRHAGVGDYNADGYQDLAVGVVSEDIGNIPDAGIVNVIYGSASGLTAAGTQLWSQDSPDILGQAEYLDAFGRGVAGFDFNADGYSDLGVGAPGDHVLGLLAAGSVNVIYGSAAALTSVGNQLWNMDSPDILGDPQAGALFGAGLPGIPAGGCGAGGTCTE